MPEELVRLMYSKRRTVISGHHRKSLNMLCVKQGLIASPYHPLFIRAFAVSIQVVSLRDGTPISGWDEASSAMMTDTLRGFDRCKVRGRIIGLIGYQPNANYTGALGQIDTGVVRVTILDWKEVHVRAHS